MPRVIIKETKRGNWHNCYLLDAFHQTLTCSVCREQLTHHINEPFPIYCPYCGAKMVGDK